MLKRLNTLWVGERLGYLEQLCLVSATAVGHSVTLYSYTPDNLKGAPDGIEIRDAREVMPEQRLLRYADSGSFALGSNFFRYELLAKNLGYWIDADIYVLKPLNFKQQYVFGLEHENTINSAVLFLPSDSEMVRDLCEIPLSSRRPPWFGPKRSLAYFWKRVTTGPVKVEDLQWGTFGPLMVSYLAKKHKVVDQAQKPSVFYPVSWKVARSLYGPAHVIEELIAPETHAVHLYNSRLVGLSDRPPPPGSYIDVICRQHGIF
jgi:hypothetical protein